MVRYPHTITVSWQSAPVKDESSGNYTPGTPQSFTSKCNVSDNSKGQKVANDGQMIEYSQTANLPKLTILAPYGATVVLTLGDGGVVNGTVKKMRNFQTFTMIWL
jgi:hypothetical protein